MAYQTDETVYIETGSGAELELELEVYWQKAEPDVGIFSDYPDDWTVTAVNGNTKLAPWVDRIVSRNKAHCELINDKLMDA